MIGRYLFSINTVFTAFATVIEIWLLNPPHRQFVDAATEARVKRHLIVTVLPSVYLATRMVQDERFNAKARQFIRQELTSADTHVLKLNISLTDKRIEVTLVGEPLTKAQWSRVQAKLPGADLAGVTLMVHQGEDKQVDVSTLKASIVSDLFLNSQKALAEKEQTIQALQAELKNATEQDEKWGDICAELHAQYPEFGEAMLSAAPLWDTRNGTDDRKVNVMVVRVSGKLPSAEVQQRVERWLKVRTKSERVQVIFYSEAAEKAAKTRRKKT